MLTKRKIQVKANQANNSTACRYMLSTTVLEFLRLFGPPNNIKYNSNICIHICDVCKQKWYYSVGEMGESEWLKVNKIPRMQFYSLIFTVFWMQCNHVNSTHSFLECHEIAIRFTFCFCSNCIIWQRHEKQAERRHCFFFDNKTMYANIVRTNSEWHVISHLIHTE